MSALPRYVQIRYDICVVIDDNAAVEMMEWFDADNADGQHTPLGRILRLGRVHFVAKWTDVALHRFQNLPPTAKRIVIITVSPQVCELNIFSNY